MIRPPVKWYGGKWYLAKWIIAEFPPHRIYLEPFGGAASVLLNKKPCEVETYNDLDLRITRLFGVLRDQGADFIRQASLIPYSEVEFKRAAEYPANANDLDKALCDFVRWRQSFAGQGKSWSFTKARARGGMAGDVNAWWTAIEGLPATIDRLRQVQIVCQSAFDVIPRFDHPEAVIYCDPPYVHSTRGKTATRVFQNEMSDADHRRLADLLSRCKGTALVSGYDSVVYDSAYSGWRKIAFDIANHAAKGESKKRQRECLWINR